MPTPFAEIEAKVNAAVSARLANATADFGGGVTVDGIFDSVFVEQQGVEGVKPAFLAVSAALPAVSHGRAVTIRGVAYRVVGIQPKTGMTLLILERP